MLLADERDDHIRYQARLDYLERDIRIHIGARFCVDCLFEFEYLS